MTETTLMPPPGFLANQRERGTPHGNAALTVQIFELFSGLQTLYVANIIPSLLPLLEAGHVGRIVVTTSREHVLSSDFADRLARYSSQVHFDVVDEDVRNISSDRVTAILLDSLKRNRPNYVISTSANKGAFTLALRTLCRSPFASGNVTSIGIIHHGYAGPVRGLRNRLVDGMHRFSRRFSPWGELHAVNPLLYATIKRQGRWAEGRVKLLPHPVEAREAMDKSSARALLGLPLDGRYIGFIGRTDGRKALPELLAAYRIAHLNVDDRLLIAGQLYEPYKELLNTEYADLIAQKRIIVLDRYFTPHELHAANCASDVVAITYYIDELSSNLLDATAARRPVIVRSAGYTGMLVKTFGVGWSVTDLMDAHDLAGTLRRAVRESEGYRPSEMANDLLRFHDPRNYAETLLRPLYAQLGLPSPDVATWKWPTEATG